MGGWVLGRFEAVGFFGARCCVGVEKEVGFPAHSAEKLLGLFDESL